MATNLLYLLAGILLKQVVDEIKTLSNQSIDDLTKRRAKLAEYRPVPAVERGSAAAIPAEARHQQQQAAAPHIAKINRRIRVARGLPLIVYSLLLIVVVILLVYGPKP